MQLNSLGYVYKIGTEWITHLFNIDDLKLYAKDDSELEWLMKIVKGFSDDIGIEFSLSKCAKATLKGGKLEKSDHARLDEETMIKVWSKRKFISSLELMSLVEFNTPQ